MVGPRRIATFREDLFDVPKGPLSKEVKFETPNSEEFVSALIKVYFDNPLENVFFGVFLKKLFEYLMQESSKKRSKDCYITLKTFGQLKGLIDSIGVNLASIEGIEERVGKDFIRAIRRTKVVPVVPIND